MNSHVTKEEEKAKLKSGYKRYRWFLTKDAKDFIVGHSIEKINLYLSQNRYCCRVEEKAENKSRVTSRYQPLLMNLLEEESIPSSSLCLDSLPKNMLKRNRQLAAAFPISSEYRAEFPDKVILGEGGSTPYFTIVLLKLHPLYGIPYLPASTIKGILRNCWDALSTNKNKASEWGDGDSPQNTELSQVVDQDLSELLFGTAEENKGKGKLIFFDAFPLKFTLTLDIENPHYPDYYERGMSPTDTQNPHPIRIICMKDVTLPIHLACTDKNLWKSQKEKIKEALRMMVEEYGIGAKTSLGYGIGKLE